MHGANGLVHWNIYKCFMGVSLLPGFYGLIDACTCSRYQALSPMQGGAWINLHACARSKIIGSVVFIVVVSTKITNCRHLTSGSGVKMSYMEKNQQFIASKRLTRATNATNNAFLNLLTTPSNAIMNIIVCRFHCAFSRISILQARLRLGHYRYAILCYKSYSARGACVVGSVIVLSSST